MDITLTPEAQAIVDREIESGRYETVEAVIVQALYQLDDVAFVDDELLVEARAQVDRGETRELTEHVWAEIRERATKDARNGVPIPDNVKY
jgi:Arc/MetJ-type ribon-helix-helix transcriptional regulator